MRSVHPQNGGHSAFRSDLQGLRAVAVLLVVLDHLVARPSGGYIGVDVFFVLSGFLITGVLLRENERTGRISIVDFYRRRMKRLAPAALLTILVVSLLAAALFASPRAGSTWQDAGWALGFAANWRFIAVGTDYLHGGGATSPLQHFWSLSVEEQFYFVWPILLIVAFAVSRRVGHGRAIATGLVSCIVVVSTAWGAFESATEPTWAYFSTFSRAWELGIGALLACCAPALMRLPDRIRTVLHWGGLLAIGLSAVLLGADSLFPVPGAIPAVLGSAAVIGAGTGGTGRWTGALSARPLVAVGTVSYSLYLWHFPVIVMVGSLLPAHGHVYVLLCLILMAALTVLSYHFVETPLRRATWRIPRTRPRMGRPPRHSIAVAALLVVVGATASTAFVVRSGTVPAPATVASLVGAPSEGPRSAAIDAALQQQSWPTLHPALDRLGAAAKAPQWISSGCLGDDIGALQDPVANAERCVFGDPHGSHRLLISGDSIAISYAPGIIAALRGSDWRVEVWTRAQCPAVDVPVDRADGSIDAACKPFRAAFAAYAARTRPDVIVLSSTSNGIDRLSDHAEGAAAADEWKRGTTTTVRALARSTGRLVVLDDPPPGTSLQDCLTPVSRPSDCVSAVDGRYVAVATAQRAGVRAAAVPNAVYPAVIPWFCTAEGVCPAFIGSTVTLADGMHLTAAASRALAPVLAGAIGLRGH